MRDVALTPLHELDFYGELAREAGPAVVVFTTPFCGSCKAVKAALALAQEAGKLPEGTRLYEVDAGESAGLTADLEVFHVPSLFLYRSDEFHAPIHAPPTAGALADAVQAAIAAPPQTPP